MSLGSHLLQSAPGVIMLNPISAANTAAATSAWIDVRKYEGDIKVRVQTGAVTGSITWTLEDATDGSGTGGAGITPNEGAFASGAANQLQERTLNGSAVRGWIRVVGTIVTGPSIVAAALEAHPKYTS